MVSFPGTARGLIDRLRARPGLLTVLQLALVGCFLAVAYAPSMDSEFAFDDVLNFVVNPRLHPHSFAEIPGAIDSMISTSRPLSLLTLAFNFWLGQYDPHGYHVFNLTVHFLNAVLLYLICMELLKIRNGNGTGPGVARPDRQIAFWGVLLWAVHPVQTQAVTYIVQRMTLLAAFFGFASILAYLYYRQRRMSGIAAAFVIAVYFYLGMMSKEIAILIPLYLLLVDYVFFDRHVRVSGWKVGAAIALLGAVGLYYLGGHVPDLLRTYGNRNFSPFERMLTEPRVLIHYLSLYAFPYIDRLHVDYAITPSRSLWHPISTLFSHLCVWLLVIGAMLVRRRLRMLSFAVLFFFVASSVEASFLNLELAFEHRIYIPSAFLLAALLAELPVRVFRRSTLLLGVILAGFVYTTMMRNYEWQTNARLWTADLDRGASVQRTTINLALGLLDTGHPREALRLIDRGLANGTAEPSLRILLLRGYAYFLMLDYDRCIEVYEGLTPQYGLVDKGLFYGGLCRLGRGDDAAVLSNVASLRGAFPYLPYADILNAEYVRKIGRPDIAEAMLLQAMEESPARLADFRNISMAYLANLYLDEGRYEEAYGLYRRVVENDPKNYFVWEQMYKMQLAAGDLKNAETIRRFLESQNVNLSEQEVRSP